MIITPINAIANVLFMQFIINAVSNGYTFSNVMVLIIQFLSVLIGVTFINNIYEWYAEPILTRIRQHINIRIYNKAFKTDYQYFDNPEFYNNYTWAVNEFVGKSEQASRLLINIFSALVVSVSMITLIIVLGPWIIAMTLFMLVFGTVVEIKRNKLVVSKQEQMIPPERKLGYVHRVAYQREYVADVKSTKLRDYLLNLFSASTDEKIGIIKKFRNPILAWYFSHNVVAILYNAGIMAYITYSIIVTGRIVGVGLFAGLVAANAQLYASLSSFFGFFTQVKELGLYVDRIKPFFEAHSPIETNEGRMGKSIIESVKPFEVQFKNVSFSYTNSNFALNNISFHIASGERVAIVGENGVGKTTLLKLLLRLYDVTDGEIIINGLPIAQYDVHSLRNNVGIAFQSPNVYALPFVDNLKLYGATNETKIREIIDSVNMRSILSKSNADIFSEVTREFSEQGIMLSVGEIQKLGLARILVQEFGLLLLDEPSSALDPIAEYELMKMVYTRSTLTTSITVAHRLSTIRDSDRIYVMGNGTIVEEGTHDELMQYKGKYFEMFTLQSENYVR